MLCSSVYELQQISNASSREDYIPQTLTVLLEILRGFTFDLRGLLSVIRKQWLKQCNYSVDQSPHLTGFRTYFTSSVWNFCRWVADVPPSETSPAAKSKEKRMLLQAKYWSAPYKLLQLRVFRFTHLIFPLPIEVVHKNCTWTCSYANQSSTHS